MTSTILLITALFILFVITGKLIEQKSRSQIKICAICFATAGSWLILLFSLFSAKLFPEKLSDDFNALGIFDKIDPIIVAALMGGSVVGFMYFLSAKIPEKYKILKLPFMLSLFWIVFWLIKFVTNSVGIKSRTEIALEITVLIVIWLIFVLIYLFYQNNYLKKIGQKLIECCRDW